MTYRAAQYQEPRNPVGTVAELFAGVGGFRVGLGGANWQTVYSNQWEPSTKAQHASDVYTFHFGAMGHSNQSVFSVPSIPMKVNLVVGGFPCQDYSVAKARGAALGLEGKKGVLWWEIVRLLAEKPTEFVLLENVDRLLKSPIANRGRDFAIMLASFGMLGYNVEWRVVNAAEYGYPQRRKRVFLLARQSGKTGVCKSKQLFQHGTFARALPIKPDDAGIAQIQIGTKPDFVSQSWSHTGFRGFSNAGIYEDGVAYLADVRPNYEGERFVLADVLEPSESIESRFRVSNEDAQRWAISKGGKKSRRISKTTGFEYIYSEGSMAFPDSVEKPSRTILTAEGGSTPSRFKHLIKDEVGYRRLVPTELERLSGFPDGWTATGRHLGAIPDSRRAFLIGNALVVGLVERIGQVIRY